MIALVLVVGAHLAGATGAAPVAPDSQAVFSRAEPHLVAGNAALAKGDTDAALTAFREAQAGNSDERAMIEYDVAQALVLKAQQDAQAAPPAAGGGEGGQAKMNVDDAKAAFERAYGLAAHPQLKSEAALASGNASALAGDVESAITQFRKAVVADPHNERAKKNLRRALDAKRAQPPPPPKDGGDKSDDDKKKDDDKKDDDKRDGDKKQDPKDGKQDEPKPEPKDGDKPPEPQPKDGDQKDQPPAKPDPKKQKQQDAKRLLDALRSREKPLTPMEMRGTSTQKPKNGKDW